MLEQERTKKRETTASSTSTIHSSNRHRDRPLNNSSLPSTLAQYGFNNPQIPPQQQPNPFQTSANLMLSQPNQMIPQANPLMSNPMANPIGNPFQPPTYGNNLQKLIEKQLKDDDDGYDVDFTKNQKLLETIEKQSKLLENLASTIQQEKSDKFSDERHFLEKRIKQLEKLGKNPGAFFGERNRPNSFHDPASSHGLNQAATNPLAQNPFGMGSLPGMGPPGWMGSFPGMMTGIPPIMQNGMYPPGMGFPGMPGMMPPPGMGLPPMNPMNPMMNRFGMNGMGNGPGPGGLFSRHPELLKKLGLIGGGDGDEQKSISRGEF